nr:hypothetical protein [Tanacetum cinerariifolium]
MYLRLTLSLGYVADFDLEEDPIDYVAYADHDEEDEEEESSKDDDDEEKEHLAPADSTVVASLFVYHVPSMRRQSCLRPMHLWLHHHHLHTVLLLRCLSEPRHLYRFFLRQRLLGFLPYLLHHHFHSVYYHHHFPRFPHHPYHYHHHLLLALHMLRDDLPEADMPLQKRARFTTPTGRFKIRESSSAAAARQAGYTLAHRVDYGFVDTMDASIRDAKSRAMTAVREVNDRVTDLATTQRHWLPKELPMHWQKLKQTEPTEMAMTAMILESVVEGLNVLLVSAPTVTFLNEFSLMCSRMFLEESNEIKNVLPSVSTARGLAIRPGIAEASLLLLTTRERKGKIKEFSLALSAELMAILRVISQSYEQESWKSVWK